MGDARGSIAAEAPLAGTTWADADGRSIYRLGACRELLKLGRQCSPGNIGEDCTSTNDSRPGRLEAPFAAALGRLGVTASSGAQCRCDVDGGEGWPGDGAVGSPSLTCVPTTFVLDPAVPRPGDLDRTPSRVLARLNKAQA